MELYWSSLLRYLWLLLLNGHLSFWLVFCLFGFLSTPPRFPVGPFGSLSWALLSCWVADGLVPAYFISGLGCFLGSLLNRGLCAVCPVAFCGWLVGYPVGFFWALVLAVGFPPSPFLLVYVRHFGCWVASSFPIYCGCFVEGRLVDFCNSRKFWTATVVSEDVGQQEGDSGFAGQQSPSVRRAGTAKVQVGNFWTARTLAGIFWIAQSGLGFPGQQKNSSNGSSGQQCGA
ncbi:hypothetical protein M5K25_012221 [Dendrobium thyrsiflorum]|uniref:Transmembrane protein n=1 Tax=Dendrobium thyrsiflorum TaxID=117978 RepID=A0ABD0UX22_DENTH